MADKPYLIEIISKLAEAEVEFIICGGMAAVYHGVERMTMDIDISLNMAPQNVKKFLAVIKALGLLPRVPVPPESLLDKKQVEYFTREKNALVFTFVDPDRPYRQIDIFLREDHAYHLLKKHAVESFIDSRIVSIISMEKLLDMKLASDFDGHTSFHTMTFEQKLTWLSEAVVSTYILAKNNPAAACNSFFTNTW